jgi:enamine deaminase RidA (YjgF/YER057c/UK114 family)
MYLYLAYAEYVSGIELITQCLSFYRATYLFVCLLIWLLGWLFNFNSLVDEVTYWFHLEDFIMSKRQAIFPAERHALYDQHRYSAAVQSGDLLFVSGQVGSRLDGSPEPDYARQVQLAFDNLNNVLKAAGCTFADVVDVTSFHTDPNAQFETFMAVREENIGEAPYPTWTAIGVNWLAGFDVELKVTARVPQSLVEAG